MNASIHAKDKKLIKKKSALMEPIHLGKQGITPSFITHLTDFINKHEVAKVRISKNMEETPHEIATSIQDSLQCTIIRVVGRVITIYKKSEKEKVSKVPLKRVPPKR